MEEESRWLGDVLAGVAVLLGLTIFGLQLIPPGNPAEREAPQTPVQWDQGGPIIGIDIGATYGRVGFVVSEHRVKISRSHDATGVEASLPRTKDCRRYLRGGHSTAKYLAALDQSPYLTWPENWGDEGVARYPSKPHASETQRSSLHLASTSQVDESCIGAISTSIAKLHAIAEEFHGSRVSQAVLAIPSDYTEEQRGMIWDAALHARLSPVHLIDQPTAIALAYGVDRRCTECNAFVLDVGSSTHAALLRNNNGSIAVVASGQNRGGDALSDLLLRHATEAFRDATGKGLDALQRPVLEDQVEMAKIRLSMEEDAVIALPIKDEPWFLLPITRAEFNNITAHLIENIIAGTIDNVLRGAGISADAVEHVILAGGSAHIPALQQRLAEYFPAIIPLSTGERYPDDAVVYGASLLARRLSLGQVPDDRKIYVQNATPMRFGVEVAGGLFATLIPRNSPLPASITRRLTLPGRTIRIFTGTEEYTNATEFVGSVVLPPRMKTTRLQITLDLSPYGVLNVTAKDSAGGSHSALLVPRRPFPEEIGRMEAEAAALAERNDIILRMQTFRTYLANYRPSLTRQLNTFAADHPQRAVRVQILETTAALDAWMVNHMATASREQFFAKLGELEELLKEDIALGSVPSGRPGIEGS
ncbi:Hsp70 protein-domain-containing protein [Mycena polygramma]|nr:Hsp70 protein-domain-containing protein [Mycena polygramma]